MSAIINEKLVAKILSVGAAFTTILVVSSSVTDPVNAPKLVALGVTGFAAFGALIASGLVPVLKSNWPVVLFCVLFLISMLVAVISSNSPLSQNIYGSYGRNNGLVTYLALILILISTLTLKTPGNFEKIVKALIFAGLVNIAYCLWVIVFGDFMGWSNPYGNILGTFGNPNFIGSFLGIFFSAYVAFSLKKDSSKLFRYSLLFILPLTAFEIYKSHAIQGRVVAALGVGIIGFLLVRANLSKMFSVAYLMFAIVIGLFALLGALQIGPMTKYVYKTSVSLRGQYWLAGWNTGKDHPLSGIGMDSFGDWYRRSRDVRALELPGVNTVVNAAHNVPMDLFAFGGWPLLLTYLLIMGFAGFAAIRTIARKKDFDAILAVMFTAWAGYQLQSLISINQIGLAIWGWILSGSLIAYERTTRPPRLEITTSAAKKSTGRKTDNYQPFTVMLAVFGGLVGLIVSLPPLASDSKWRNAQMAQSAPAIEETMKSNYMNLQNSTKYLTNIQNLESSNLFELSHKYALEAVLWNPESFELWKVLYLIKNSNPDEKERALANMKRLDPLNPDVTSTK